MASKNERMKNFTAANAQAWTKAYEAGDEAGMKAALQAGMEFVKDMSQEDDTCWECYEPSSGYYDYRDRQLVLHVEVPLCNDHRRKLKAKKHSKTE